MAIQYEAAPVAKPAGGSSHDGYWSHNVDLDNRIPWNHQSTPPPINNSNNFDSFQVHSAAAQSQGTQQQPPNFSNTGSTSNANPNSNSNRYANNF